MINDVNTYALGLQLNLTDTATPVLEEIENVLMDIEKQIASLGTDAMLGLVGASDEINNVVSDMKSNFSGINDEILDLLGPLGEMADLNTEAAKQLADEADAIKDGLGENWEEILEALRSKEGLLETECQLLEEEVELSADVRDNMSDWEGKVSAANRQLQAYLVSLLSINDAINEGIEASELFKNANYRLYGSQSQLTEQAMQLAAAMGMQRQETIQAFAHLGNIRVPLNALNQLATANVQFNRLSGVGVVQVANWQKTLLQSGFTAAQVTTEIEHMAFAMRRFGLDTNDVNAVMAAHTDQMMRLRTLYGNDFAQATSRTQLALAAVGKELGLNNAQIQQMVRSMGNIDPVQLEILAGNAGMARAQLDSTAGQMEAMARIAHQTAMELRNANGPFETQAILTARLAGLSDDMRASMAPLITQIRDGRDRFNNLNDTLTLFNSTTAGVTAGANTLAGALNSLSAIFSESNQTTIAQLQLLWNSFKATFAALWSMVEPFVVFVLSIINTILTAISWVIRLISGWMDAMGTFGKFVKGVLAAVVLLFVAGSGVIASTFTWLLGFLTTGFGSFGAWFAARIGSIFTSLSASFASAMQSLANAFTSAATAIANGLAALRPHIPVLLTLAAVLVAAGVAAWLFAQAAVAIASTDGAALALVLLTAAIVGLAFGLVFAATITGVTVPILLALGLALIMAGAAAWLFAQAVLVISQAGPDAAINLIALAVAIAIVAVALAFAASITGVTLPLLITLAVVLLAAAVAAWIFAQAMAVIVGAVGQLDGEAGVQFALFGVNVMVGGLALLTAASTLVLAGFALLFAVQVLAPAILMLTGITVALMVAGVGLMLAGRLMQAGVSSVASSFETLAAAGVAFQAGANAIIVAAGNLLAGAGMVFAAAALLGGAALVLLPATAALILAMTGLWLVGRLLLTAGVAVMIGGIALLAGAIPLGFAADLLAAAATDALNGAELLMAAAPALLLGAGGLAGAGAALLMAAFWMVPGVLAFAAMASLFEPAALGILAGAMALQAAAGILPGAINQLSSVDFVIDALAVNIDTAAAQVYTVLDAVLSRLGSYATEFEMVAGRIANIFQRVLPSSLLNWVGVGVVQTSAILSTQPKSAADKLSEMSTQDEMKRRARESSEALSKTVDTLGQIFTAVQTIGGTGQGRLMELLEKWLPIIAENEDDLLGGTSLNSWKR
jgi:hypothetical protein